MYTHARVRIIYVYAPGAVIHQLACRPPPFTPPRCSVVVPCTGTRAVQVAKCISAGGSRRVRLHRLGHAEVGQVGDGNNDYDCEDDDDDEGVERFVKYVLFPFSV